MQNHLEKIIALLNKQIKLAKINQWDEVIRLEQQRMLMVEKLPELAIPDQQQHSFADLINTIRQQEKELLQLSEQQKETTASLLKGKQQSDKALKAYKGL